MKNLVEVINLLLDDVKKRKVLRKKVKKKKKKHIKSSQTKEVASQFVSNVLRPFSTTRLDGQAEEAEDKLIEEIMKQGATMEEATDAGKQK